MRYPDASKDFSVVQDGVETQKKENIDVLIYRMEEEDKKSKKVEEEPSMSEAEIGSNDVPLEGVDSVTTVVDEDHFEHISLKDQDIGRFLSGGLEEAAHNLSGTHEGDQAPQQVLIHISYYHGDIGYSPMGSPAKPKAKAAMPIVSTELLHSVDSAIMGKPESLDKLKNFVNGVESFGTGEEAEGMLFWLLIHILLQWVVILYLGFLGVVTVKYTCSLGREWLGDCLPYCEPAQGIGKCAPWLVSTRLMLSLEKAMAGKESRGPACTFEFDGESSGLLGSGESLWPFTDGYAFETWIYVESFADTLSTATAAAAITAIAAAKSGKSSVMSAAAAASALAGEGTAHMPRLFSFLSADNQGVEAYIHAQFLVVESGLPWLAINEDVQKMAEETSLLDAEIGGHIHLFYHPLLLNGQFCSDASPSGAAAEALWALAYGGPMSLFPLAVSNVDKHTLEPQPGNIMLSSETAALAAPIFRIISMAIQQPGNNDELSRDEELVAAIVTLRQSLKNNHALKDANAIQMHLDGCRRCYCVIHEKDSLNTFSLDEDTRPVGEVNALVDELLVVVEFLIGATSPSLAMDDVRRLLDCPQPNQDARVLHLIYRLVVQPNTARAQTFAEAFISSGGIESLLVLLQKEAKAGDHSVPESMTKSDGSLSVQDTELESDAGILERSKDDKVGSQESDMQGKDFESLPLNTVSGPVAISAVMNIERMSSVSEFPFIKNLGGISHFIQCKK
ncbi:hypothetical protein EZV62_009843 [Acer yangbiense]|uniref:DUF4704 domain-containing protein n=1 Tax=Acer yangbiense TaxID=1000413 RepID=A0A5C7I1K6_9ROSI|nr:hypothetical protein EZV62_009843 [Acer yangbiense]